MSNMKAKQRIIVALDVKEVKEAIRLVDLLKDEVGVFKIGLELQSTILRSIIVPYDLEEAIRGLFDVNELFRKVNGIFWDGKFHDIPNTVGGAVGAIANLEPFLINVHISGGVEAMKVAKQAAMEYGKRTLRHTPKIIGVTVLTSLDYEALVEIGLFEEFLGNLCPINSPSESRAYSMLKEELPDGETPTDEDCEKWLLEDLVVKMAMTAKLAGLDGVVASPQEIELIREFCGPDFLIVTPGVRPAGADVQDQKRVMTPEEAVVKGADYVVIGRPITQAEDPVAATRAIARKIEEVSHE